MPVLPAVPFDQRVARLDVAALLGRLDHRQADAVLDRAAGILAFQLQVKRARADVEVAGTDDRGVADQFEYGIVGGHAVVSVLRQAVDSSSRPFRPLHPPIRVGRAAAAGKEAAHRPRGRMASVGVVHPQQPILGGELLALHLAQGHVIDGQYAELGVQHLLVQFLVPVIQLPELGTGFHLRFEFRLRLSFEHGNLLGSHAEPGQAGRDGAGGGRSSTCRGCGPA
jgi:hypothetical protein